MKNQIISTFSFVLCFSILACSSAVKKGLFFYNGKNQIHYTQKESVYAFVFKNAKALDNFYQSNFAETQKMEKLAEEKFNFDQQKTFVFKSSMNLEQLKQISKDLNLRYLSDKVIEFNSSGKIAIVLDRLVVNFNEEYKKINHKEFQKTYKLELISQNPILPHRFTFASSSKNVLNQAIKLQSLGEVEYAVPDMITKIELHSIPNVPVSINDDQSFHQWYLDSNYDLSIANAWDYTMGNKSIPIGIFDTAVDIDHPDLQGQSMFNHNESGQSSIVLPTILSSGNTNEGHGTKVAGISLAKANNDIGVGGICPECSLMALKGFGSHEEIANTFLIAAANGVRVLNCSWSIVYDNNDDPFIVKQAVDHITLEMDVVVVFSAGNVNVDSCEPEKISASENVLTVGSSNDQDKFHGQAFGNCIDLVAPGFEIFTTGVDCGASYSHSYCDFADTSAAAPIVSGVCGLLRSLNDQIPRKEIHNILKFTCDKIDAHDYPYENGRNDQLGHGRVNAFKALVPFASIGLNKLTISKGQCVDITISSSCPLKISMLGYQVVNMSTGSTTDMVWFTPLNDEYTYVKVFDKVKFDNSGVFKIVADVRDSEYGTASHPGYPHQASEGFGVNHLYLEVTE